MITASSKSSLFAFRGSRVSTGVGIDIGQCATKVVVYRGTLGQPPQYLCASMPTEAGLPFETAALKTNFAGASSRSAGNPNLDASPSKSTAVENRLNIDDPLYGSNTDFSRWSPGQTKSLAQRIAGAQAAAQLRKPKVTVSLSMAACDFRSIQGATEEPLALAVLHQTIQEALQDYRPRCIATIETHTTSRSKLRALSLPQELANGLAHALDDVGLTPSAIEGIPWSLQRAVQPFSQNEPEIGVVLDWGFGKPTLVSVVDGRLDYIRRLNTGGLQAMVEPAQQDLRLTDSEAMRWLHRSLAESSSRELDAAIVHETRNHVVDCCAALAEEINAAIEFIRWRHQGRTVNKLITLGGAGCINGLLSSLQAELNVNVEPWSLQNGDQTLTSEYAIAASLAATGAAHAF